MVTSTPPVKLHLVPDSPAADTVDLLRVLLAMAEAGQLRGVSLCAMQRDGRERIYFTGSYGKNPALAVNAAARMSYRLAAAQDEADADAERGD
jgi:hypothetical protein